MDDRIRLARELAGIDLALRNERERLGAATRTGDLVTAMQAERRLDSLLDDRIVVARKLGGVDTTREAVRQ